MANFLVVSPLDKRWNSFLRSIYLLQKKLEYLGVVQENGEIRYLGEESENA